MLITLKQDASQGATQNLLNKLSALNLGYQIITRREQTMISVAGTVSQQDQADLAACPPVANVATLDSPYPLVSSQPHDGLVHVGNEVFGGQQLQVIAGPCSVETPAVMQQAAHDVHASGARLLRGGAFKPRTNPYAFQGQGVQGLHLLREAAKTHDLPIVTEIVDPRHLDGFLEEGVDLIQVGARNMQNYELLKELGKVNVPVLLKRGMAATVSEWLCAAEYIASEGNDAIILCERGVRGFESSYRNMLDVSAIAVAKKETHLPVICDPSHAAGHAWLIPALAKAAIAVGADGLIIEMHPTPGQAWSDAKQALTPQALKQLISEMQALAACFGRTL